MYRELSNGIQEYWAILLKIGPHSRQNMAGQKMQFHLLIEISLNIKTYQKVNPGVKEWESAWFHLTGDVKKSGVEDKLLLI